MKQKILLLLAACSFGAQAYQIRLTNLSTQNEPDLLVKIPIVFWTVLNNQTASSVIASVPFGASAMVDISADANTLVIFDGSQLYQSGSNTMWRPEVSAILGNKNISFADRTVQLLSLNSVKCPICRFYTYSKVLQGPYNVAGPIPPSGSHLVLVPRIIQPGDTMPWWGKPTTRNFEVVSADNLGSYWTKWAASIKNLPIALHPSDLWWRSLIKYIDQLKLYCTSFGLSTVGLDAAAAAAQAGAKCSSCV